MIERRKRIEARNEGHYPTLIDFESFRIILCIQSISVAEQTFATCATYVQVIVISNF